MQAFKLPDYVEASWLGLHVPPKLARASRSLASCANGSFLKHGRVVVATGWMDSLLRWSVCVVNTENTTSCTNPSPNSDVLVDQEAVAAAWLTLVGLSRCQLWNILLFQAPQNPLQAPSCSLLRPDFPLKLTDTRLMCCCAMVIAHV